MQRSISEDDFIKMLAAGAHRTADFMAKLTDYHGGPTATEYILTSDIARALLEANLEVEVECRNQRLLTGLTQRKAWKPRLPIGAQRTDVAVLDSETVPCVMIEVKIGVQGTLRPIRKDLDKICNTLESMKAKFALDVRAASVFQVHVPGKKNDLKIDQMQKKVFNIETSLTKNLKAFAATRPDFAFRLVPLQGETDGYMATEIVHEDENNTSLGRKGHATRYYAILIQSLRKQPSGTGWQRLLSED